MGCWWSVDLRLGKTHFEWVFLKAIPFYILEYNSWMTNSFSCISEAWFLLPEAGYVKMQSGQSTNIIGIHMPCYSSKVSGIPKMQLLSLIGLFWALGFPLHKPYPYSWNIGEDSSVLGTWNVWWWIILCGGQSLAESFTLCRDEQIGSATGWAVTCSAAFPYISVGEELMCKW